jgi:hypothetical protein
MASVSGWAIACWDIQCTSNTSQINSNLTYRMSHLLFHPRRFSQLSYYSFSLLPLFAWNILNVYIIFEFQMVHILHIKRTRKNVWGRLYERLNYFLTTRCVVNFNYFLIQLAPVVLFALGGRAFAVSFRVFNSRGQPYCNLYVCDVALSVFTSCKLKSLFDRSGNRTRDLWFAIYSDKHGK